MSYQWIQCRFQELNSGGSTLASSPLCKTSPQVSPTFSKMHFPKLCLHSSHGNLGCSKTKHRGKLQINRWVQTLCKIQHGINDSTKRFLFFYQNKIILLLQANHSNWPARLESKLIFFFFFP